MKYNFSRKGSILFFNLLKILKCVGVNPNTLITDKKRTEMLWVKTLNSTVTSNVSNTSTIPFMKNWCSREEVIIRNQFPLPRSGATVKKKQKNSFWKKTRLFESNNQNHIGCVKIKNAICKQHRVSLTELRLEIKDTRRATECVPIIYSEHAQFTEKPDLTHRTHRRTRLTRGYRGRYTAGRRYVSVNRSKSKINEK